MSRFISGIWGQFRGRLRGVVNVMDLREHFLLELGPATRFLDDSGTAFVEIDLALFLDLGAHLAHFPFL